MREHIKKGLKNVGILVVFGAIIFGVAFMGYTTGVERAATDEVFNVGLLLISVGFDILMVAAAIYLHIVIHELGHLIAGRLSGYTFILFRIASFGIIKEEDTFKTISLRINGTGGQCLMTPPETSEKRPYRFYLMGGVLANFITSLLALLIYLEYPSFFTSLFIISGVFSGLLNGIPFGFNDGKMLSKISKSPIAQEQFFQQLSWSKQFIRDGKRFNEIIQEKKVMNPDEPITEHFNVYTKLVEINALLEQKQFDRAFEELSDLYDQRKNIIAPYQIEVLREFLFCFLILEKTDTGVIKDIRSDKLFKTHLKTKQVEVYRIKSAVAYFIDNDRIEAEKQLDLSDKYLKKAPTYADKEVNRILLDHLKEIMEF